MRKSKQPKIALSLRQPYAWAVLHAGKDIENRSWQTTFRGRFIIHASRTVDYDAIVDLRQRGFDVPDVQNLPTSAFVGEATIIDCVPLAECDSPWAVGPWCFLLANPVAYHAPIRARGQLGLFEVDL